MLHERNQSVLDPMASSAEQLRLLLVDDDTELCAMMQEYFAQLGHVLDCAANGRDGLTRASRDDYDIVLLDVMLPSINGFSVLQQLRRRSQMPVIMLTARVHRDDRIAGLSKGADDYITKPFDPEELLARIHAVLRRTGAASKQNGGLRVFQKLQIDATGRSVRIGDRVLDLTELEFDILELLSRSPGRIVSREEITETLLNRPASPYDRALDVHLSRLRDKLGEYRGLIRTVRGAGYIFSVAEP